MSECEWDRQRAHIIMFSGGICSWATARRVADKYRPRDLRLLFADTLMEHEDLYRFLDDAAASIGVPITRVAEGRTPWQVFQDVRYLGNTRADPCSRILKRELLRRWLDNNCDPAFTTVYLGYDWSEVHRAERAASYWSPWHVESPMTDRPYLNRTDMINDLRALGIRPPRLYELGFAHNNCGGFCIKQGQAGFANLLRHFPARYAEHERQEEALRQSLGKDVAILRDRRGGQTRPLTLRDLREQIESGCAIDMFDIGGCACFEEPL